MSDNTNPDHDLYIYILTCQDFLIRNPELIDKVSNMKHQVANCREKALFSP